MISVSEASSLILQHRRSPSVVVVPLAKATGRVLAQAVFADRDFPPYDRVAMDGIAIRQADFLKGIETFIINGIAAAGEPAKTLEGQGTCMEVMTGAVLPAGADAVIRYEDVTISAETVRVNIKKIDPGMNIHGCGSDLRGGEVLLSAGTLLSVAEIPMLASVGISEVPVFAAPHTALITTGDELVAIGDHPLPHQIRRSNMSAVEAALSPFGADCAAHHFSDREFLDGTDSARQRFRDILLQHDLVILSGGVSKGKFDWVPAALESSGIRCIFHSVAQRPGKPLWFGTGNGKVVFALPGNPVSVFLCLYKYVLPWLRASLGISEQQYFVALKEDLRSEIPLTHFVQVKLSDGGRLATPVPGGGSGDFVNLRHADAFIEVPPKAGLLTKGMSFPCIRFRY